MTDDKRFEIYYDLLIRKNAEFNLTAITKREDVWLKHFKDSLLSVHLIKEGASVLDVGSGAGFPGLALKIARGDIELTLVESIKKKADFLKLAAETLELSGVSIINKRIEDVSKDKLYDVGVARAVAKTATLVEYILPYIKIGGIMIAYKAKDADIEAEEAQNAIKLLGGKLLKIEKIDLEGLERNLIIIKKEQHSPPKYPRSGNKPKSSPL